MTIAERFKNGISIHALVKRATQQIKRINKRLEISIHALVKRATDRRIYLDINTGISIHALVKRATPRPAFSLAA